MKCYHMLELNNCAEFSVDLYFPDFNTYALATVKFSDHNKTMFGTTTEDDKVMTEFAINELCGKYMITQGACTDNTNGNPTNGKNEIIAIKSKFSLEWHHNEDLDTYQLIPAIMHYTARHAGAGAIIRAIQGGNTNSISKSDRDAWRTLLGFSQLP